MLTTVGWLLICGGALVLVGQLAVGAVGLIGVLRDR